MSEFICYSPKGFSRKSQAIIDMALEIIEEYQEQGFDLTLRQLYYQFVSRDAFANTEANYDKLGRLVNEGRLSGDLPWDAIVDRTRNLRSLSHWSSPQDILQAAASSYRIDKWEDQPYRVEVWVEKEALAGVVERAANALDVPFFCCRGYVSQSEMHDAANRMKVHAENGQIPKIVHLGDHDPSGIDMTDDITRRMELFRVPNAHTIVERIALNLDQIRKFNPPPNPAKLTDSRAGGYVQRFGFESWELDALDPKTINKLITDTVLFYRDDDLYSAMQTIEQGHIDHLNALARGYKDGEE